MPPSNIKPLWAQDSNPLSFHLKYRRSAPRPGGIALVRTFRRRMSWWCCSPDYSTTMTSHRNEKRRAERTSERLNNLKRMRPAWGRNAIQTMLSLCSTANAPRPPASERPPGPTSNVCKTMNFETSPDQPRYSCFDLLQSRCTLGSKPLFSPLSSQLASRTGGLPTASCR